MPLKGRADKAYLLTKYSIWVNYIEDPDKIGEYDNVSVQGYLLSK